MFCPLFSRAGSRRARGSFTSLFSGRTPHLRARHAWAARGSTDEGATMLGAALGLFGSGAVYLIARIASGGPTVRRTQPPLPAQPAPQQPSPVESPSRPAPLPIPEPVAAPEPEPPPPPPPPVDVPQASVPTPRPPISAPAPVQ